MFGKKSQIACLNDKLDAKLNGDKRMNKRLIKRIATIIAIIILLILLFFWLIKIDDIFCLLNVGDEILSDSEHNSMKILFVRIHIIFVFPLLVAVLILALLENTFLNVNKVILSQK